MGFASDSYMAQYIIKIHQAIHREYIHYIYIIPQLFKKIKQFHLELDQKMSISDPSIYNLPSLICQASSFYHSWTLRQRDITS